jgi:lipid-binding SYLF domain-containing protein
MNSVRSVVCISLVILTLAGWVAPALAEEPQEVVDNSLTALKEMAADPGMDWFRNNVQKAKAVVIVPNTVKAGFIFGGSGGNGVVMTRGGKSWSHPSFVGLGSVTFGLQAGVEVGQLVLVVMTKKGLDALLSTKFQLGGDASVSAGPVGAGAKAATTDILAFSRSAGAFAGVTVEGATITPRDKWNRVYYDNPKVAPVDILVTRNQVNGGAEPLRKEMAEVGGR